MVTRQAGFELDSVLSTQQEASSPPVALLIDTALPDPEPEQQGKSSENNNSHYIIRKELSGVVTECDIQTNDTDTTFEAFVERNAYEIRQIVDQHRRRLK